MQQQHFTLSDEIPLRSMASLKLIKSYNIILKYIYYVLLGVHDIYNLQIEHIVRSLTQCLHRGATVSTAAHVHSVKCCAAQAEILEQLCELL